METKGIATTVSIDSFGRKCVVGEKDGRIECFLISQDGKLQFHSETNGHEGAIWTIAWLPPSFGQHFISGGYDGFVRLWRLSSGQRKIECLGSKKLGSSVNQISITSLQSHVQESASASNLPEQKALVACALSNGTVSILDALTFEEAISNSSSSSSISQLSMIHPSGSTAVGWQCQCCTACSSKCEKSFPLLVSGGADGSIVLHFLAETAENKLSLSSSTTLEASHKGSVSSISFAPSSSLSSSSTSSSSAEDTKITPRIRFASASEDGTVKIHTHPAPLSQEHLCKDWDVAEIATRSPAFKVRFCESERQVLVAAGTDSDSVWEETETGKWVRFTAIKASEEKGEDQKVEESEKAKEVLA